MLLVCQVKQDGVGGACNIYATHQERIQNFRRKT